MKIFVLLFITFFYLVLHLFLMKDYGVSWDFHYHHYAGLYHLGQNVPSIDEKAEVFFTSPDPRLTIEDPFGPFTQTLPTLSYIIFYERLGILPFDSAYNLPMVIIGALGVGLLFLFIYESLGFRPALIGALFLAFLPSHFGYIHTNMKDVPNAFAFTLAVYTFWRLVKKRRVRDLLIAAVAFAFAFNVKINSIMIPVVCVLWVGSLILIKTIRMRKDAINIFLYFFIAPIFALAVWWPFWADPLKKLLELPHFYSLNTINIPVLLFGTIYTSGVNIPWWYPYVYIGITTPIPIFVSFVIGFFFCIRRLIDKKDGIYLLLFLWLFVPLLRYFSPTSGAIDGVRHFMEVVYPLCFIAGIGGAYVLRRIARAGNGIFWCLSLVVISLGWLVYINFYYHPYQTSYFNVLIGGIRGANQQFDIDFWGTPQREAMIWLNAHAYKRASINIVMAQSSAGMYLRDDLLEFLNTKTLHESDYVVVLNRPSFWNAETKDLLSQKQAHGKVVYTRDIQGVPLVWIVRK